MAIKYVWFCAMCGSTAHERECCAENSVEIDERALAPDYRQPVKMDPSRLEFVSDQLSRFATKYFLMDHQAGVGLAMLMVAASVIAANTTMDPKTFAEHAYKFLDRARLKVFNLEHDTLATELAVLVSKVATDENGKKRSGN